MYAEFDILQVFLSIFYEQAGIPGYGYQQNNVIQQVTYGVPAATGSTFPLK